MGLWDNITGFFTGKKTEQQSSPMPQTAVSAPPSPPGQLSSSPTDMDMNVGGRRRRHRKTKKAGRRRHRKTHGRRH